MTSDTKKSQKKKKNTPQSTKPALNKGLPPFENFSEWFNQVIFDAERKIRSGGCSAR